MMSSEILLVLPCCYVLDVECRSPSRCCAREGGEERAAVKQAFLLEINTKPLNDAMVCSRGSKSHARRAVSECITIIFMLMTIGQPCATVTENIQLTWHAHYHAKRKTHVRLFRASHPSPPAHSLSRW